MSHDIVCQFSLRPHRSYSTTARDYKNVTALQGQILMDTFLVSTFSGVGYNFRVFQGIFPRAKKIQGFSGSSRFPGFVGHPYVHRGSSIHWNHGLEFFCRLPFLKQNRKTLLYCEGCLTAHEITFIYFKIKLNYIQRFVTHYSHYIP